MNRFQILTEKKPPNPLTQPPIYVGWISSKVGTEEELRKMGVTGKILLNYTGEYEYCDITKEVGLALKEKFGKKIFLGAFTAIDAEGNQLPADQQIFWKLG